MLVNGRTHCLWVRVSALTVAISSVISIGAVISAKADDDDLKKGAFIPTGVQITPLAAPGSSFQALNPGLSFDPSFTVGQAVTTAISPNGNTLLILTSGFNSQNFTYANRATTRPIGPQRRKASTSAAKIAWTLRNTTSSSGRDWSGKTFPIPPCVTAAT